MKTVNRTRRKVFHVNFRASSAGFESSATYGWHASGVVDSLTRFSAEVLVEVSGHSTLSPSRAYRCGVRGQVVC